MFFLVEGTAAGTEDTVAAASSQNPTLCALLPAAALLPLPQAPSWAHVDDDVVPLQTAAAPRGKDACCYGTTDLLRAFIGLPLTLLSS